MGDSLVVFKKEIIWASQLTMLLNWRFYDVAKVVMIHPQDDLTKIGYKAKLWK